MWLRSDLFVAFLDEEPECTIYYPVDWNAVFTKEYFEAEKQCISDKILSIEDKDSFYDYDVNDCIHFFDVIRRFISKSLSEHFKK